MYVETPLIESHFFGDNVLLKLESAQPSGSFKSRGMTRLIDESYAKHGDTCHIFACSGGNAGLAAAEAAKHRKLQCTVVVPRTTKARMIDRIAKIGGNVIVHGAVLNEADAYMKGLMEEALQKGKTPIYCHPFDNPSLWDGHSTLVDEIHRQICDYTTLPSAIVLSCGGGGLYIGVMKGLERLGWAGDVPVVVVETSGASCFHESLKAKKPVVMPSVNTVATSLASTWVPQEAVDYALQYNTVSVLVSDDEAIAACKKFAHAHSIIVEPACGATLAGLSSETVERFSKTGPVIAIVCGGTSWGPEDIV